MLWTHVTHNIQTPTTYAMDRRRPQYIPTTYQRCPQHIVTHNRYVHNIHPQHKTRCPQHMSVMDTRTTYQMLSTTYLTKNPCSPQSWVFMLWTTFYMLWTTAGYMLWTTPTGYVVDGYVVDHIESICCGWHATSPTTYAKFYPQHVHVIHNM